MLEPQYRRSQAPLDPSNNPIYTHSRTRTTSSNTFPDPIQAAQPPVHYQQPAGYHMPAGYNTPMQMHLVQPQGIHQRRSPSVNTFSTVSSAGGGMPPPAAYRTSPTTDLRRSTSSRSGGVPGSPQPTSYIALLRKQKGTAWCDRAQYEDPRLQAQQRAAKMRANLEAVGAGTGSALGMGSAAVSGRTSTGLSSAGGKVAAKIRHHGKPAVVGYAPDNNYVSGGVPLRLSATEVEGGDSDEDDVVMQRLHHRRTGSSGRSSTASGRRTLAYRSSGGLGPLNSQGGSRRWSPGDTPERTDSLVEGKEELMLAGDDSASGRARSVESGSSKERLDNVPDLAGNAARLATNSLMNATITREKSVKNPEDLRRRGSVDERTMTLTSGRLFIANPD
ncbi:hypothetical protein QBC33DRAFT_265812 [Phialemonium atrogriseum]|uniref:Uncharacterized protein n=1 Tax=Phialemonium atrogriseum TaxID=1093897 RepID=A0AAJ0FPL7_9PEZI|nr:uncharacterized protein QBC33DRAFT_265812 [Phialemonium atrogriseum]KAK1770398.1 hypothetical protein QBC33DRAFT_265812 [Phialemonium atrogriseum]